MVAFSFNDALDDVAGGFCKAAVGVAAGTGISGGSTPNPFVVSWAASSCAQVSSAPHWRLRKETTIDTPINLIILFPTAIDRQINNVVLSVHANYACSIDSLDTVVINFNKEISGSWIRYVITSWEISHFQDLSLLMARRPS